MYSPTVITLLVFIAWALFLLVLMESMRSKLVVFEEVAAIGFNSDNTNLSLFMQRLARTQANGIEGLPIFGGLMLIALVTSNTSLTDPLAYYFLSARCVQSLSHFYSLSTIAAALRFSAFVVQMIIAVFWSYQLVSLMV